MHEVARPEHLQLYSWEFRFKARTCSELEDVPGDR